VHSATRPENSLSDKEVADTSSKGKEFKLWHLGDQELSEAEKEELEEYAKSCGYQPGSMLFGGVDEEILGCIRDKARAKIIGTLSKSVGFPKLESDISGLTATYCRQSLLFQFEGKILWPKFCYLCDKLNFSEFNIFPQSMLLSKALRMQQDLEDKKNEIIIEGLENKIKDCEASLEKDFLLQPTEGSLVELQAENAKLNEELLQAQATLKKYSECFEQEKKELQAKCKAKADKNTKLQESLKELRNKCLKFGSRRVQRLKGIFSSVGASSDEISPSVEEISDTFKHIENEDDALDEVITGHGDFCALLASRGTTAAFLKTECMHAKIVNKPTFSMSPSDLIDIPGEARSIGNRFITQIWAKGGRELAGDEARNLLKSVRNLYLLFALICIITFTLYHCLSAGLRCRRLIIRSTFRRLLG
jgi:hypothetical protein